jgi:hypothetical protein
MYIFAGRTHYVAAAEAVAAVYTSGSIRTPAVVHLLISSNRFLYACVCVCVCMCVYVIFFPIVLFRLFLYFFFYSVSPHITAHTHTHTYTMSTIFFFEPFADGRDERSLISTSEIVYTYTIAQDTIRYDTIRSLCIYVGDNERVSERAEWDGTGRWQYYARVTFPRSCVTHKLDSTFSGFRPRVRLTRAARRTAMTALLYCTQHSVGFNTLLYIQFLYL